MDKKRSFKILLVLGVAAGVVILSAIFVLYAPQPVEGQPLSRNIAGSIFERHDPTSLMAPTASYTYYVPLFNDDTFREDLDVSTCQGGSASSGDGVIEIACPDPTIPGTHFAYQQYLLPASFPGYESDDLPVLLFELTLYSNTQVITGTSFSPPLTITLQYQQNQVPNNIPEDTLRVIYYDEDQGTWADIPNSDIVARDTGSNTITFTLGHLSYFAMTPAEVVYLPLIAKDGSGLTALPSPKVRSLPVPEITPSEITGGYHNDTHIVIQNIGTADATVDLTYKSSSGSTVTTASVLVPPFKTKTENLAATSPFYGSVIVNSDQPIAAVVNLNGQSNGTTSTAAYSAFDAANSSANIYLPGIMNDYHGWYSSYTIQNTGVFQEAINILYKTNLGDCAEPLTFIDPNTTLTKSTRNSDLDCLQDGAIGSATIQTTGDAVIAVGAYHNADSYQPKAIFNGLGAGQTGTGLAFPLVQYTAGSGYTTGLNVTSVSSEAQVTVTYTPNEGGPGSTCTESKTVGAGQNETFAGKSFFETNPGCNAGDGFLGAATLASNAPVAATIVNEDENGNIVSASNGIKTASATSGFVAPAYVQNFFGWNSSLQVMNVGTTSTAVYCTPTSTYQTVVNPGLGAGQGWNVPLENGTSGSVLCETTGGPIIGIVNEVGSSNTTGDWSRSYTAFNK